MDGGLPKLGAHQVPFADYLRWPANNWHTLEPFRLSAKHGRHAMLIRRDASEPQVVGDAAHTAILEPARFAAEYIAMPDFDGHPNSKIHKDAKGNWQSANAGKIQLTTEEYDSARAMGEAVRSHRIAGPLVAAKGRNELSILWKESETGTVCKSRVDMLRKAPYGLLAPASPQADQDVLWLPDLKTTRNIEPHAFERDMVKYGYHGQLASYDMAIQAVEPAPLIVCIVAVENRPPYDVAVFRLSDEVLEHGRRLFKRLLRMKAEAEAASRWPGIGDDGVIPLRLPVYAEEMDDAA